MKFRLLVGNITHQLQFQGIAGVSPESPPVFILSAISPCTTVLKALYDPLDCTLQIQSNSQITDIPLSERQRVKDDHLPTSLRFINLALGMGPNARGLPF